MVADSRILSSEETIAIVDSWQALLKKGDQGTLAKEMGVAPAVVGNLKSIEAEVNGDRAVSSKAIEKNGLYIERNAFLIHAHVHNNTIIDSLQAGIVRSLKHNPYVQKRVSIQRRNLELLRQRIGQEIADLDSTKASVLRLLSAGNSNPKSFLIDPSALNSEIVKLYEKLLETEESLQLLDDIQVIQPFNRVVAPDSPKKWQCLMIGLLAGLGGALLVIIARQVRERMKELPVH